MKRYNYFYSFSILVVLFTSIASVLFYSAVDTGYQSVDNKISNPHKKIKADYYKVGEAEDGVIGHPLYEGKNNCRDCIISKGK